MAASTPPAAPSAAITSSCRIPECTRPRYESCGVVHDFCGRTHAAEAVSRGIIAQLRDPHGICHECKLDGCSQTVYFDSAKNRVHDFCSRSHANKAIADGQWTCSTTSATARAGVSTCKLPGCQRGVWVDPVTSIESEFCTKMHRAEGMANADPNEQHADVKPSVRNTHCDQAESKGESREDPYVHRVFRGATNGVTDFALSVLSKTHSQYKSIVVQFVKNWIKPEPSGGVSVERIFRVEVPPDVRDKNQDYAKAVGNVRRCFHGTSCSWDCNFFADMKGQPCGYTDCNLCGICTEGFKQEGNVGATARRTRFNLRFGEGLYFSNISGKANDYAQDSEKTRSDGRKVRCMFVVDVAAGKTFKTQDSRLPLNMCPPVGYDSVVGEAGQGLNYDETVVYKDEAAIPTHLIVYACD